MICVTFSGPASTDPCTLSLLDALPISHFAAGVAAVDATGYTAESARHLTITDGTVTADSNASTVGPGAMAGCDWKHVKDQIAGAAFRQTATAYDRFGNVKTDYNDGAML